MNQTQPGAPRPEQEVQRLIKQAEELCGEIDGDQLSDVHVLLGYAERIKEAIAELGKYPTSEPASARRFALNVKLEDLQRRMATAARLRASQVQGFTGNSLPRSVSTLLS